jgi:succinoglycan biosynthesis transport protein ExoP
VDCDLRRSKIRNFFAAAGQPEAARDSEDAVGPAPSYADPLVDQASGISILAAPQSPCNPHAVLASAGFSQTLEKLRTDHDLVIIDTPPVLAVPDALSLATLADDVVMLVQWRRVPRSAVFAALKTLRRAHIQVSGIVLSKVDLRRFARSNTDSGHSTRLYPTYHSA